MLGIWLLSTLLAAPSTEAAAELEARLLAPCCWTQTLDFHASPLASSLRGEIDQRLSAGDSVEVVEAELVGRYGERIRAVPRAGFLTPIGQGLFLGSGLAFLGLLGYARRARRRPGEAPVSSPEAPEDRRLLEQALRELDEGY